MADLLRPGEVSKEFGFDRDSLRNWEESGILNPQRTPGGHRRYQRSDLENLLTVQTQAQIVKEDELPRRDLYHEFGTTGLRQWSGSVYEERLRQLRGREGRIKYREMRLNDPVISAVFFALTNALMQPAWEIHTDGKSKTDEEAALFVEQCIDDLSWSWDEQLSFFIEPTLEQGFSIVESVYKKRLGDHPPKYTDSPAISKYSDGKIGWRKFAPRPAESLADGQEWDFDENGGIKGVRQQPASDFGNRGLELRYIPVEKFLLFRTTNYPANTPEGLPIHRSMYIPYHFTRNIQEIEGIGIERNLGGLPVMYLGNGTSKSGPLSDYQKSIDLGTQIRRDERASVVFPHPKLGMGATEGDGILLELLSGPGGDTAATTAVLERYDKLKAVSILAQFIMLGMNNVGSYALSKHQGDIFILSASAMLKKFSEVINRHAIPKLIGMNVFPGLTAVPYFIPGKIGIPDLGQISQFINTLVNSEVLTPDEELEKYIREVADLPQRLEQGNPAQVMDKAMSLDRASVAQVQRTTKQIRDLSLALQTVSRMGMISDKETDQILRPFIKQIQDTLGVDENMARQTLGLKEMKEKAGIGSTLSQTHERDIKSAVISPRVARQKLVESEFLTIEQFNELELSDGRLPNGVDILTLFESPDEEIQELLDLGPSIDPVALADNDPAGILLEIEAGILDNRSLLLQDELEPEYEIKVKQAIRALEALQAEYLPLLGEDVAEEAQAEEIEQQPEQGAVDEPAIEG